MKCNNLALLRVLSRWRGEIQFLYKAAHTSSQIWEECYWGAGSTSTTWNVLYMII